MTPEITRAWSQLTVKGIDEEQRFITGIASSPVTDRQDDIVEPAGAKFTLPLPLLFQHRADRPIGHVIAAKVSEGGIAIEARIQKGVQYIDEAWELIKRRLVCGLSIGFKGLVAEPLASGGRRFKAWEWLELSAVTIAANQDASILSIKTLDLQQMRAAGNAPLKIHIPEKSHVEQPSHSRLTAIIGANQSLPFVRYAIALGLSKGYHAQAAMWAEGRKDWSSTPGVVTALKAAAAAGTTGDADWAAPLVQQSIAREFIAAVRPATVLGRLEGVRTLPFGQSVPRVSSASTAGWVEENRPKPVSALAFDTINLAIKKLAASCVLSNDVVKYSAPSAEQIVQQDMVAAVAKQTDVSFLDPASTANAARPASVTAGLTPITSSGDPIADAAAAIGAITTAGGQLVRPYFVARPATVAAAAGQMSVPTLNVSGGFLSGIPVLVSASAPATSLVLVDADQILLADQGGADVSVSTQATVEMSDAPSGAGAVTSLWQLDLLGLLVERFINWDTKDAPAAAAAIVTGATYP